MSSDSENSSGDEDFEAHSHLFKSSLDVGSHFIDILPENELVFTNQQGTLFTQLTIKNVTTKAHIAYFVFTSAPFPIIIMPKQGFIPPSFQQVINIGWQNNPDPDKLSHAMFFIKALPLSPDMNIEEMSTNLTEVFNTYNVNILFTVAALPSRVSIGLPMSMPIGGAPNFQTANVSSLPPITQQAKGIPPSVNKIFNDEHRKQGERSNSSHSSGQQMLKTKDGNGTNQVMPHSGKDLRGSINQEMDEESKSSFVQ